MTKNLSEISETQVKSLVEFARKFYVEAEVTYFSLGDLGVESANDVYMISISAPWGNIFLNWLEFLMGSIIPEVCESLEQDGDYLTQHGNLSVAGVMVHAMMNKVDSMHPVDYIIQIYNRYKTHTSKEKKEEAVKMVDTKNKVVQLKN